VQGETDRATSLDQANIAILAKIALRDAMPSSSSAIPVSAFSPLADLPEVTASVLKNKFGQVASLATAAPLAVSRHHRREFVLLTAQQYEQLQQSRRAPLEALTAEFDQLVNNLNTPKARRAADSLFAARGPALGRAALKARRAVDA